MESVKYKKERQDRLELRRQALFALKKETYVLLRFIFLTAVSAAALGLVLYISITLGSVARQLGLMFGRF